MVAVNLLASLLITNNCRSMSPNIVAKFYNGEIRVIWFAITLAVQCRLSYKQSPLGEGVGYLFPCYSEIDWRVPFFPQNQKNCFLLFTVPEHCLCSPQNLAFSSVPLKQMPLFPCSLKPLGGSHMHLIDRPGP